MSLSNDKALADHLAKILLMQSRVGQLTSVQDIADYLCQGIKEIPGIGDVWYSHAPPSAPEGDSPSEHIVLIPLTAGGSNEGTIGISVSHRDQFEPYSGHIVNLGYMISLILEERRKQEDSDRQRGNLEQRVHAQTQKLEAQVNGRKSAELAALDAKQRMNLYLEISETMIVELDNQARISAINSRACEVLGYSHDELLGQDWIATIIPMEQQNTVRDVFNSIIAESTELAAYYDNHVVTKSGTERHVSWHNTTRRDQDGHPIGTLSAGTDITDQASAFEHMQRDDKLSILGVLAGGIAHDFNNFFGGVFGFIDLALMEAKDSPKIRSYLELAASALTRATDLTDQLMTFAHGGVVERKPQPMGALVERCVASAVADSPIAAEYHIEPNVWPCDVDENQMTLAIGNVVLNAQQAMPQGGDVEVTVKNVTIDSASPLELRPGPYVQVSIKDFGIGIPEEIIENIFDPFFTTKPKAHGLGLATCFSIMQKHDGVIDVESIPGEWTELHLYTPRSSTVTTTAAGEHALPARRGPVILMDDEPTIRMLLQKMLARLGYEVIQTSTGDEALAACAQMHTDGMQPAAVFLDLTVPKGKGGKEVAPAIREIVGSTPIFAISGHTDDELMTQPEQLGFTDALPKPFRMDGVAQLMRRHIESD